MKDIAGHSNRILTTLRYLRHSEQLIASSAEKFGSTFRLNMVFGDMLVVSDPEDIKVLYTARPESYEPLFKGILEPLVGEHSLFMQKGETHKHRRGTISSLLKYQSISRHAKTIEEVTLRHFKAMPLGRRFDMQTVMRSIVIEIMVRFVFGDIERERLDRYIELGVSLDLNGTPGLFLFHSVKRYFLGFGPWRRYEKTRNEMDAMVYEDIRKRRQATENYEDFLSQLMHAPCHGLKDMSDDELRDQIMTIILAGYGTTALSLAWGFFHLHFFPETLKRLREEISAESSSLNAERLHSLPYLEAIIKETLRISPVVNLAPVRLKESMTLAGREMPAESIVAVSIRMAHHRPETFADPAVFRPERFLEHNYSPFEFLPFGGGSRRCVGATYADLEMKLILGRLVQHFQFNLLRDTVPSPVNRHLFTSPEGGVPMEIRQKCE
ncbi:cytochrome P450 [Verrucomicrobia bacterium]|jgi:cytochrome P450|nr:cytochrome P450 [Verrucomicrobiota bacterium]